MSRELVKIGLEYASDLVPDVIEKANGKGDLSQDDIVTRAMRYELAQVEAGKYSRIHDVVYLANMVRVHRDIWGCV